MKQPQCRLRKENTRRNLTLHGLAYGGKGVLNVSDDSQENSKEKAKGRDPLTIGVSILALIVSATSVFLSWYWNSPIGDVRPIEPSGYAIMRGIDPTFEGEPEPGIGLGLGPYPSDHIILPLEWANNSGNSILVKEPVLLLHKLGRDGEPTGSVYRFFLVGEFPETSAKVFNHANTEPHTFKNSLIIEPHTVMESVSVFRVAKWWSGQPNECFRFIPGDRYSVEIQYRRIPEDPKQAIWWRITGVGTKRERSMTVIEKLTIQTTVDFLNVYGPTHPGENIGWDFFSLLPGSRSTQGGTVPRADPKYRYEEEPPCQKT